MHPVLLEIPAPRWNVPLGPVLLALALVLLGVAELGRRGKATDLVILGGAGSVLSLLAALREWRSVLHLAPLPLYSFGVLVSASLVVGWALTVRLATRAGFAPKTSSAAYLLTAAGGLAGARLLYVLTNLSDFPSLRDALSLGEGGLVFYGGVLGGAAASLAYARARRFSWLAWADACVPSLAFGAAVGRLGCYLAGCDYGRPLGPRAPSWLVRLGTFPRWPDEIAGPLAGSPAWLDHVLYRGLSPETTASLPVHPTELYESLAASLLLLALLALAPRRAFRGQLLVAFVIGYGAVRFFLETLRDDPERGFVGPLSTSQWIAMATVLVAGASVSRLTLRAARVAG